MRRELEFKILDKKTGKFVNQEGNAITCNGKILGLCGIVPEINVGQYFSEQENRFEVLEYTGLKDSSDNKIFTGYVLKCSQEGQSKIGEVVFHDGGFWWEFEKGKYSYLGEVCKKFAPKIIGNIYQRPELLKGE